MRHPRSQRGFSLLEVVISTMLIGLLLVVSMRTVTATRLSHRHTAGLSTATDLAQELLSEVLAQAYEEPDGGSSALGTDSGETSRDLFDDVDDYAGYESTPPATRDGTSIDGLAGWTRRVSVEFVEVDSGLAGVSVDQGLKRITVAVLQANGGGDEVVAELSALCSRRSMLEQTASADTEAIVWVGATLSLDDNNDGRPDRPAARMGVHLPNLVPNPN